MRRSTLISGLWWAVKHQAHCQLKQLNKKAIGFKFQDIPTYVLVTCISTILCLLTIEWLHQRDVVIILAMLYKRGPETDLFLLVYIWHHIQDNKWSVLPDDARKSGDEDATLASHTVDVSITVHKHGWSCIRIHKEAKEGLTVLLTVLIRPLWYVSGILLTWVYYQAVLFRYRTFTVYV